MIGAVLALLVALSSAVPITDQAGTYMTHVAPSCRLNYLTCQNENQYEAKKALCAALTTEENCTADSHCWWENGVGSNNFIDMNNGVWDLVNETINNPVPGVHNLFGFSGSVMAAPTVIETDNYTILINFGQYPGGAKALKAWIVANIGKPLRYLILTHAHPDEMMDASSLYTPGQQLTLITPLGIFTDLAIQQSIAPTQINPPSIPGANLIRNFGLALPRDTNWRLSEPLNIGGAPLLCSYGPFVFPPVPGLTCNYLTSFPTTLTLDGLPITFFYTPADLPNQMSLYFPTKKYLFASDVIPAMFPPLATYRGDAIRPIDKWIASTQALLQLQLPPYPGWDYLGTSSIPLLAPPKSFACVSAWLALLQHIQTHVLNGIRNNVAVADIETSYAVPEYLQAQLLPFFPLFTEMYHHIGLTIRGAIMGYIGAADATFVGMRTQSLSHKWQNVVDLAGSAAQAVTIAKQAVAAGSREDLLLALSIGEALKGLNEETVDAQNILFQSCYRLAMLENGYTARNFYLTCAWENKPVASP